MTDSVIHDISLEGVCINNSDSGQTFNPNTYIEVEFDLASKEESIHYRLPALTRHSSSNGVGAMFLHFSTGTFKHFHRILYQDAELKKNPKRLKNRWSPRKNVNLNLSLYQSGEKITDASTSNLSFEGLFIKTALSPPLYSFLTVEFSLDSDDESQTLKVPCLVRHRNNFGIGLMFINFQLGMFNRLRHKLYDNNIKPGLVDSSDPETPLLEPSINMTKETGPNTKPAH